MAIGGELECCRSPVFGLKNLDESLLFQGWKACLGEGLPSELGMLEQLLLWSLLGLLPGSLLGVRQDALHVSCGAFVEQSSPRGNSYPKLPGPYSQQPV
jgi:hypothetical protein